MLMTVTMIVIAMIMAVITIPKIYYAFIDAKLLFLEEELELLREHQSERSECMLRHLGCGLGAILLIWVVKGAPDLAVPNQMAPAVAIFAAGSLFCALLESLLVHKIDEWLHAPQPRVEIQNQR